MLKKILAVWLAAWLCCWGGPVLAEAETVTAEELTAFAESLRSQALKDQLLNDPEASQEENGYAFIYDFATLYAKEPKLSKETPLTAVLLSDPDDAEFRGMSLNLRTSELLAGFRNDNPSLAGSREGALLYLDGGAETGFRYGRVYRDGQRIRMVEYGEFLRDGTAFRHPALQLAVEGDWVSAIRLTGLTEETDAEAMRSLWNELAELSLENAYTQVPSSMNGLELSAFSEADLVFDGLDFLRLTPESFGGYPDDVLVEDEDGKWLRVVEGDGFNAVFSCEAGGANAQISSYTVLSEDLEGPRGVRLGDQFHEDFCRFRNGENETEGETELLYGIDGTAPYGKAFYADGDGMTLRYVTAVQDGRRVELYLHYTANALTEMILYVLN